MASFTTLGASLAWAEVLEPVYFCTLFSALPTPEGFCEPAVGAFLPRRPDLALRATALMYTLLRDDDKVLNDIRFRPGYTEQDAAFETFATMALTSGAAFRPWLPAGSMNSSGERL